MTSLMPAASISRARFLNCPICVLQIGQSTKRRNCRWTRRFASGRFMASPVTASITIDGSMSPDLNFIAFPLALAIVDRFAPRNPDKPAAACGDSGRGPEIGDHAHDVLGDQPPERTAGIDCVQ